MSVHSCDFDESTNPSIAGIRLTNTSPAPSRRAPRIGYLAVDGHGADFACAIRDYDGSKATLVLNGWLGIPEQFSLYVEPEGMRYACTITGRRGNSVQVTLADGCRQSRSRTGMR